MGEPREVAVLQSRLLRREEELAAAQLENRTLRASQRILEAELRRDDVDSASARIELEGARRSLSESQVVSSSLGASLRHEEGVREAMQADHAAAQAEADAQADAIRSEVAHEEGVRQDLVARHHAQAHQMLASGPSHSSSAWRIHTRHARGRSASRAVAVSRRVTNSHGQNRRPCSPDCSADALYTHSA